MNPSASAKGEWYYRPWVVILLLFFVLGPFGLFLVYKSPRFSPPARAFLTVLITLYTWYLLLLMARFFYYQISNEIELLRLLLES